MEEGMHVEAGVGLTRRAVLGWVGRGLLAIVGAGAVGAAMPASEALARGNRKCGDADDDEARRQCRSKRRAKRGR